MKHHTYKKKTKINVPVDILFHWHERKGAVLRLTPPWSSIKLVEKKRQGIKKGVRVKFIIKFFKIPFIWESEHTTYQKNKIFKDEQIKGPFSQWKHTHIFKSLDASSSIMEDKIEFKLPFGFLLKPFYRPVKKALERIFNYRHNILKYDLENLIDIKQNKRILISGASGTIGNALVPFLQTRGYEVIRLVRKKPESLDEIFWDPYKNILDLENKGRFDAVISLNGVDISRGRWTNKQKELIINSRLIPTKFILSKIKNLKNRPEVFICASAIGFYGDSKDKILTETSNSGDCFISNVCELWEKEAMATDKKLARTVNLRIGIVFTPFGGIIKRMSFLFKLGLGLRLSHGRQYMSWISIDDVLSSILFILNNKKIFGPVNLTAPEPVTNQEFSNTLGKVFSKKVFFYMPKFLIKLIWGQMGKEILLSGARVFPKKLLDNGFSFRYKKLFLSLKDMFGR